MEKLLTTEEVAGILGVTPDRVRRYAQTGAIAYVRLGGVRSRLRFRPRQVEAFITAREHPHQPGVNPGVSVLDEIRRRRQQTA